MEKVLLAERLDPGESIELFIPVPPLARENWCEHLRNLQNYMEGKKLRLDISTGVGTEITLICEECHLTVEL